MNLSVDYPGGLVRAERPSHLLDLELVAGPEGPLLGLDDLKAHLGIEFDDDDDKIKASEAAVHAGLDGYSGTLGRALLTQTWRLHFDHCFPRRGEIRLPLPPLQSVASVSYVDPDGVTQTLAADQYVVLSGQRAGLAPAFGVCWPTTRRQLRAVAIDFVAGYGAAADVPEPIKEAIRLEVGTLYETRESVVIGPRAQVILNPIAEAKLVPFRLVGT